MVKLAEVVSSFLIMDNLHKVAADLHQAVGPTPLLPRICSLDNPAKHSVKYRPCFRAANRRISDKATSNPTSGHNSHPTTNRQSDSSTDIVIIPFPGGKVSHKGGNLPTPPPGSRMFTPKPYPLSSVRDNGKLPTVSFTSGPPSPTCTKDCGKKCKGAFCDCKDKDCTNHGKDFIDPNDPDPPKDMDRRKCIGPQCEDGNCKPGNLCSNFDCGKTVYQGARGQDANHLSASVNAMTMVNGRKELILGINFFCRKYDRYRFAGDEVGVWEDRTSPAVIVRGDCHKGKCKSYVTFLLGREKGRKGCPEDFVVSGRGDVDDQCGQNFRQIVDRCHTSGENHKGGGFFTTNCETWTINIRTNSYQKYKKEQWEKTLKVNHAPPDLRDPQWDDYFPGVVGEPPQDT
ncbi:hypothetical protein H109_06450 [Trichophyton interdigitale MR816]|uniref:Uncharacterized protein n=1 Tax=Trichophyton interdigitale (strain MR816) TaxID=1215338 RepID=A0A059J177_TRIIM|nr:hypothetical protein H109_06450 [Trichophyton interdigitale MR816]